MTNSSAKTNTALLIGIINSILVLLQWIARFSAGSSWAQGLGLLTVILGPILTLFVFFPLTIVGILMTSEGLSQKDLRARFALFLNLIVAANLIYAGANVVSAFIPKKDAVYVADILALKIKLVDTVLRKQDFASQEMTARVAFILVNKSKKDFEFGYESNERWGCRHQYVQPDLPPLGKGSYTGHTKNLRPGEQLTGIIKVTLSKYTPPGEYEFQMYFTPGALPRKPGEKIPEAYESGYLRYVNFPDSNFVRIKVVD